MDNSNKGGKKRNEYEGVIFEPSARLLREAEMSDTKVSVPKRRTRPLPRKPQKSRYALFYAGLIFTGVVTCIVVFMLTINGFFAQRGGTVQVTPTPVPTAVAIREINSYTGIIKEISASEVPSDALNQDKMLKIMDVRTNKNYLLIADFNTQLKDKYGKTILFPELAVGQIVDASFDIRDSRLITLTHSAAAWQLDNVKDAAINIVARTITLGNTVYTYDDELLCFFKGKPYDMKKVNSIDVITLAGYNQKASLVRVEKSHGTIKFINGEKITDGSIEIDTSIFEKLDGKNTINVSEGLHRIVVKGTNIEPYITDVDVWFEDEVYFDLSDVNYKLGVLTVKANEPEYMVSVDGVEVKPGTPLSLDYGEYTIRVAKDDFITWEKQIVVNQPVLELTAELKREAKLGKIKVITEPDGAEAYIDNALIGKTPVEMQIAYGNHELMVRKDGYTEITLRVMIDKVTNEYLIGLQRKEGARP